MELNTITSNCGWQLGDGSDNNFWLDNWCGQPIASHLNIPSHLHPNLSAKVSDFIVNGQWNFPDSFIQYFPQAKVLSEQVHIPFEEAEDKMIWEPSSSGDLSFK